MKRAIIIGSGRVAERCGVEFAYGRRVERVDVHGWRAVAVDGESADVVVVNADVGSVIMGLLHVEPTPSLSLAPRSMSGWNAVVRARRAPRVGHTVLFPARPYLEEFADIFDRGRWPVEPTVYICAQESCHGRTGWAEEESLFLMVNAPAGADVDGVEALALRRLVDARLLGAADASRPRGAVPGERGRTLRRSEQQQVLGLRKARQPGKCSRALLRVRECPPGRGGAPVPAVGSASGGGYRRGLRAARMTTLDVLVLGAGPSGLALAGACTRAGLSVAAPDPDAPWVPNYGAWADELPEGRRDWAEVVWREVVVHVDYARRHVVPGSYVRVDGERLQASLLDFVPERRRGTAVDAPAARLVVDTTGAESPRVPRRGPANPGWQVA